MNCTRLRRESIAEFNFTDLVTAMLILRLNSIHLEQKVKPNSR